MPRRSRPTFPIPQEVIAAADNIKGSAQRVMLADEINIAIGNKEPRVYFGQLREQCEGGAKRYGNITEAAALAENFRMNCIPEGMEAMEVGDYPVFLAARRKLMACKIKAYFESL